MGFNIRSSSTEPIYEQKYWFFFGTLIRELFLLNSPLFLAAVRSFLRRTVRDHLIWAFQTILLFSLKLEKKGLNISSIQTSNFTFGLKQGFFNKTLKGGLEFFVLGADILLCNFGNSDQMNTFGPSKTLHNTKKYTW